MLFMLGGDDMEIDCRGRRIYVQLDCKGGEGEGWGGRKGGRRARIFHNAVKSTLRAYGPESMKVKIHHLMECYTLKMLRE
jgi:hypothetical protein